MGSASLAKTILIPATISLALYVFLSHLLLPFTRRYHARYAHYLPLHTISAHTSSLRDRIADTLMRLVLRSSLSRRFRRNETDNTNDNISIDDEEGEIMVGMHMDAGRRETLERRWNNSGQGAHGGSQERLSRDLEEGFMDDSDEEQPEHRR